MQFHCETIVADPGGVDSDQDPTFEYKPNLDPTVKKKPSL